MLDDLAEGTFSVVFSTPDIIFHVSRLNPLWGRATWRQRLKAVFFDEAHCISAWGSPFREVDDSIKELRSWVSPGVAFVGLSATLPRRTLEDIKSCARFKPGVTVFGVKNDRTNIRLKVQHFQHKDKVKQLDFLMDFQKTIVYFETLTEVGHAERYLQALAPDVDKSKIAVYHDYMSKGNRKTILEVFTRDEILLLLSTEAHETDYNPTDVVRVVQLRCPSTISCLAQRFDRAARNPMFQGLGILLAETESTTDPYLTQYITTKECRRKVLNAGFDDKDRLPNGNCCDLCHPLLVTSHLQSDVTSKEVQVVDQAVDQAKKAIRAWRTMVCERDYIPLGDFSAEGHVMTDGMIERLGEKVAEVMAPESIRSIITWIPLKKRHLEELASILIKLNRGIMQPQHQEEQIISPQHQVEQTIQPQYQAEQINVNQDKAGNSHHVRDVQPRGSNPKPMFVFNVLTSMDFSAEQISKRRRKK